MSNDTINGSETQHVLDPWRITSFLVIAGLILGVFTLRLFTIQIIQQPEWEEQAEDNRITEISVPTQRGVIYDRNDLILAQNIPSYNVAVTPAFLPDDEGEIEEILRQLAELTSVPLNLGSINDPLIPCGDNLGVRQMVEIGDSFAPFQPVLIQCDADKEIAMVIQEKAVDWPGVSVQVEPVRDYPTGVLTASIVGYLGPIPANEEQEYRARGFLPGRDKVGYGGIEVFFQDLLAGENGRRVVEVDNAGQVLRDVEPVVPPKPGLNLVLTLDTRLQKAAYSILEGELNTWNAYFGEIRITSGVVIAMNPRTGEILAMISYPSYENNRMARFIPTYYYEQLIADATEPLLNHAVGAEIPAGSVFKLVTAVGALNEGVVTPEQVIDTPPLITVTERYYANDPGQGREFVDWNEAGFGSLDFVGGLANSSNVYFYKLGGGFRDEVPQGLGICRLGTYARAMGYGQELGIELPDETSGLIPNPTWKRQTQGETWSTGDTYITSVGQGFVIATPLQVLMSAAVVANDGVAVRPTLVREVLDGEGNVVDYVDEDGVRVSPFQPDPMWDITSDRLIQVYENPDGIGSCKESLDGSGNPIKITVEPWVIEKVQEGMRQAVVRGTLEREFNTVNIAVAGKTGTAEYCDEVALSKNRCQYGNWPSHAWTVAYAPYDDPEIAVIAFAYNGEEGASVAAPIVRRVIEAYFEIKAIDAAQSTP